MNSLLLLIFAILTVVLLLKYIRGFYLIYKLPGPSFIIFLKELKNFLTRQQDLYTTATTVISSSPLVFKIFTGTQTQIVTSRPQDAEIVFTNCLEKGIVYEIFNEITEGNTLVGADLEEWHKYRKLINNSFKRNVVNSFTDIFTKQGKNLVKNLEGVHGKENKDLMILIWNYTLRSTFETLADVELDDDVVEKLIQLFLKLEYVFVERLHKPWFNIKAFWNKSKLYKEQKTALKQTETIIQEEVINKAKNNAISSIPTDPTKQSLFLNNLFSGLEQGFISEHKVLKETLLMIPASSESTASAISYLLIALGIYPEIQDKVYKEIISTISDDEEINLEGVNQLDYLERVIKETMRIKPPVPYIGRKLDKDIFSEPFTYPAGSEIFFSIDHLHKNSEIWEDPLKFDPDRFLPEEFEKRHRCAYIPFSHGVRNCIGLKYAMLSIKCTIAEIVRNYRIVTLYPKEFADVKVIFTIVAVPSNYSIEFMKRK